ncbi:hypothetical protein FHX15_002224 [Rhizobium sp. BK650]|uniref:hypothetical protein n=1 Tax=Rhizobium sp. BK650 TaxID=2586990 RepID=UPI00160EAD61|nr:hypothetical protein [Rhizobium sp. BK650]MBB3656996.1 hypothetical protein [Rhizobium sp. BK650]
MRFFALILVLLPLVEAHAAPISSCTRGYAPDEPVEGRFMALDYALIMHVLAERLCMAEPKPMRPRFLGYLEKHGCGPGTEIYTVYETAIAKMQDATIKQLAQDGDENLQLSENQVREWASTAVKELGGCDGLKKVHDADLQE